MHWLDLEDSEGLSGGLEPEGGQQAVQHSWLEGKRRGAAGGGLPIQVCEAAGPCLEEVRENVGVCLEP